MNMLEVFAQELEQESHTTRKMLERVPTDKLDWQPHPKSMTLRRLAAHVAELPGWIGMTFNTSELNFDNNPYEPQVINSKAELMDFFQRSLEGGKEHLQKAHEDQLAEEWQMLEGGQVMYKGSKGAVIRMAISQIIHHRAQLGVYLRLLDIPIPGSYGPSADDETE
ncbi:DinB family protein [Pontibacter qinzhouensis]|uniref:DinB family protein n=1 Tax=Pontibacter qinzhouensis TaxID=2603253 RepID=A0A5C8KA77_9BACT|nr:DinB family protein [Pontibacter qinzhouensis]TXK49844.1 DinB family protein [Pontibacter qinzhouensis]